MIGVLRMSLDRWNTWCERTVNRRILSAMITVGGFTLLVKAAAIPSELLIAYHFGTSDAMDAFYIAILLPSFAVNVISGSLNVAFIPTYIELREREGLIAAQRLLSSVMFWSLSLLIFVSSLLVLAAPYILSLLGSGFTLTKLKLTVSLFFAILPILIISGLTTIWAAVLNAGERFALAAVAPITTPLVIVVALLVAVKFEGIYTLAIGTVIGAVLEAGLLAWGLQRQGLSLIPRWHGMDLATKQVIKQYIPMVAGALLMSSTALVNQSMAAMLGPGSVSALGYGGKVVSVMLGIGTVALGSAVLPYFSRMVAFRDWKGVRHTLKTYTRLILFATVPLTLVLIFFSEPLIGLLFERGAFTEADTHLVGQVQALYFLQVPFYILGMLGVRLLSALAKNQILMIISGVNLIVNIIGNYALMQFMGVAGISFSTSIVYVISTSLVFLSLFAIMRKQERLND